MTKLHEILAAEKTVVDQIKALLADTHTKFGKPTNYFQGSLRTLRMLQDSPGKAEIENAERSESQLVTNVHETLDYMLTFWAKSEDFQATKNQTNLEACSYLDFRGKRLADDLPVDELLGLEARLTELRGLLVKTPTLNAAKRWTHGATKHTWQLAEAEKTTKTAKVVSGVILAPATDKHPAQVEKVISEPVIGEFTTMQYSGEVTAQQKADLLAAIDDLIAGVKQARSRCNEIEVVKANIGSAIKYVLMEALMASGEYGDV